ncbi:MAG: HEPN domain-containing protein [Bacteroidales bacterium]|nr:HEPN domain-containing protein [Candidatus Minthousia equi]
MTEKLNKEQSIREMAAAEELIEVAKVNMQYGFYNSAVNRLYYACFHAINATLLHLGIQNYKSHDGAKQMFGLHCVKTGLVDKKWGHFFTTMMQFRNDSDYDVYIVYKKEEVEPLLPECIAFIEEMKSIISK